MAIQGIGNSFLNSITDQSSAMEKADQAEFEALLEKAKRAGSDPEDAELMDACADFEAYFVNKIFSEMRKSIPESDLIESDNGKEIYEDMLYDAYSQEIAKGKGMGIKEMLYKQMTKSSEG